MPAHGFDELDQLLLLAALGHGELGAGASDTTSASMSVFSHV